MLRVVDAFINERIDKTTYDQQLATSTRRIALTELEIHEAKLEELVEAAFALSNSARR
jgi:hypothetical protein